MKVNFINVGRNHKNWTAEMSSINYDSLRKQVKNAVLSKNPDFEYDEETGKGEIYAGWNCVGTFEVEKEEVK